MPRILFFGMSGAYSAIALRTLAQASSEIVPSGDPITIAAVVLPQFEGLADVPYHGPPFHWTRWGAGPSGIDGMLPTRGTGTTRGIALPSLGMGGQGVAGGAEARTTRQVARELGLPLLEVASLREPAVQAELAHLAPDAIVVACFPWRVPQPVLRLPRYGILNLHPSLLPAHRGPDPLFWTFRQGEHETGVTAHLMTAAYDAGPILAQEPISVPDGVSEGTLERACAQVAGRLAAEALTARARGTATPRAQEEALATYDPLPIFDDYQVDVTRPARWAFNFSAGLMSRPEPVWVDLEDAGRWRVLVPLGFAAETTLPEAWHLAAGELELQCAPGVFRARVAPLDHG